MLSHLLASPTVVTLGGRPHLARPLTLGDFALLLRAAADALGRDEDGEDAPTFGESEVAGWMTGDGAYLMAWCSLRREWPGLSPAEAAGLVGSAAPEELGGLFSAALRRCRAGVPAEGSGVDPAKTDWAAMLWRLREVWGYGYDAAAAMTLDQVRALVRKDGKAEGGKPGMSLDEANRLWEEAQAKRKAEGPRTIEDYGYRIKPENDGGGGE